MEVSNIHDLHEHNDKKNKILCNDKKFTQSKKVTFFMINNEKISGKFEPPPSQICPKDVFIVVETNKQFACFSIYQSLKLNFFIT